MKNNIMIKQNECDHFYDNVFSKYESEVRSYCRSFPVEFGKAKGSEVWTKDGKRYIDFLAGAGALNYGHNHDLMKKGIMEYIQSDNITHGLDLYTTAKLSFLKTFHDKILEPRGLNYRTQFCGPTGTNAVEAALKIARKFTGRLSIFSFQGGFHGMTLGALAATGNGFNRKAAGVTLTDVHFMPYPNGFIKNFDSIEYMDSILSDPSSGYEKPAAVLLETVQAEGGVYVAPVEWLKRLRDLCDKHGILMIVDDIQVGCGRVGNFFSFERASIIPDIVTLSKSISGYGLPMAIVLLKPEIDSWEPGEHNGTFRGNQLAFIGARIAIDLWENENIQHIVDQKSEYILSFLKNKILPLNKNINIRGLGLIWGIDFNKLENVEIVNKIISKCFNYGLIIESAGRKGKVVKLLPPLTIPMKLLKEGCEILKRAIVESLN